MIVQGMKDRRHGRLWGLVTMSALAVVGLTGPGEKAAVEAQSPANKSMVVSEPAGKVEDHGRPPLWIEATLLRAKKPLEGVRWEISQSSKPFPLTPTSPGNSAPNDAMVIDAEGDGEAPDEGLMVEVTSYQTIPLMTCVINDEESRRIIASLEKIEHGETLVVRGGPADVVAALSDGTMVYGETLVVRSGPSVLTFYGRPASFMREREVPFFVRYQSTRGNATSSVDFGAQRFVEKSAIDVVARPGKENGSVRLRYALAISEVATKLSAAFKESSSGVGTPAGEVRMPEMHSTRLRSESEIPIGAHLLIGGMTWTDSYGDSHPLFALISTRSADSK